MRQFSPLPVLFAWEFALVPFSRARYLFNGAPCWIVYRVFGVRVALGVVP